MAYTTMIHSISSRTWAFCTVLIHNVPYAMLVQEQLIFLESRWYTVYGCDLPCSCWSDRPAVCRKWDRSAGFAGRIRTPGHRQDTEPIRAKLTEWGPMARLFRMSFQTTLIENKTTKWGQFSTIFIKFFTKTSQSGAAIQNMNRK